MSSPTTTTHHQHSNHVNLVEPKNHINNNMNHYQMNHSANHQKNNKNTNDINIIHHEDTDKIQNNDNHQYVLNHHNNKIDTEIKENRVDITDTDIDDELVEDWQILKKSTIDGEKVKLVPYKSDHVQTYNKWLNDPYIQQMTQTEPYSLSQEFEFQKEWMEDETKYIFIILDKTLGDNIMAGDINIFIQNDVNNHNEQIGELNIMIAEQKSRRKGLATETLQLIIKWATDNLEIKKFIAKIQHDNHSSITLFKKLGFVQTEYVDAFKEYTFTLNLMENKQKQQQQQQQQQEEKKKNHHHTWSYYTD